jgi:hypothetical protein
MSEIYYCHSLVFKLCYNFIWFISFLHIMILFQHSWTHTIWGHTLEFHICFVSSGYLFQCHVLILFCLIYISPWPFPSFLLPHHFIQSFSFLSFGQSPFHFKLTHSSYGTGRDKVTRKAILRVAEGSVLTTVYLPKQKVWLCRSYYSVSLAVTFCLDYSGIYFFLT